MCKEAEEVGVDVRFKLDEKLFRRYTHNELEKHLNECQFADDAALPAKTRRGAEKAISECITTVLRSDSKRP